MNALVMYDHQTDTLWSQFVGEAIDGPLNRTELEFLPSRLTTMGEWVREHPDTLLLERGLLGAAFDPYQGYYVEPSSGILGEANRDDRLDQKALIVGVTTETTQKAYPFSAIDDVGTLNVIF